MFEAGPSKSLICSYAMVTLDRFKQILQGTPTILKAYNAKVEDILDTIRKFGANRTILSQIYEVDRYVVDAWLTDDPRLKRAADDYYESIVDIAENGLMMALQRQDPWAILHVLRSRGAARGWGEKIQINLEEEARRYNINLDMVVDSYAKMIVDKSLSDDGQLSDSDNGA